MAKQDYNKLREGKKGMILLVEDGPSFIAMFQQALADKFPEFGVMQTDNLEEAQDLLRNHHFSAAIVDNGFLAYKDGPRVGSSGPEGGAGVMLIRSIRQGKALERGGLGTANRDIPIAFNSAELYDEKMQLALASGGNTRAFEKGKVYFGGKNDMSLPTVTGATMQWFAEQLTDEKMAAIEMRRAPVTEAKEVHRGMLSSLRELPATIAAALFGKREK